jgi:hypothetical protein
MGEITGWDEGCGSVEIVELAPIWGMLETLGNAPHMVKCHHCSYRTPLFPVWESSRTAEPVWTNLRTAHVGSVGHSIVAVLALST